MPSAEARAKIARKRIANSYSRDLISQSLDNPGDARQCRVWRNVKVPMRDGVRLSTSIYLPPGAGPFPVVLVRTAYNRVGIRTPDFWNRGIATVAQDCRGRYDSAGVHHPFIHEAEDGHDTLEWIGRQPWCNGKIGMFGASYLAATQFLSAPLQSRYLAALNPQFMAADCWKRAYYCDGAFSLALTWSWLCFECSARTSEAGIMPVFDVAKLLRHLPILTLDEASGAGAVQSYRNYVQKNRYDAHWKGLNVIEQAHRYRIPMLLTGGWYDYYPGEAARMYLALRQQAPTPGLRDAHRLLLGPWTHGFGATSQLGEVDFGPEALAQNDSAVRWLDCLLHGRDVTEFQRAPVRLFVMGINQWRDETEWPLARMRIVKFFLREGGRLATRPPSVEKPDRYTYDPNDPVPTLGGNHSVGPYNPGLYDFVKPGPYDQRPVESRPDLLTYTTEELTEDTEVTGPVVVTLHASSSARDTDFVARLCDVHPDGRSIQITEGVIRARFRDDVWGEPTLLEPGKAYEFTIDMQITSNVFRRGHRIRLHITSSNFPLWDRNLNTGHDPATDTEMRVAEQTIFHDPERASHVALPMA